MLFMGTQKLITNTLQSVVKKSSHLKYCDVNNLYGRPMSQKLFLHGFKWVKEPYQFSKSIIKSYNDYSYER